MSTKYIDKINNKTHQKIKYINSKAYTKEILKMLFNDREYFPKCKVIISDSKQPGLYDADNNLLSVITSEQIAQTYTYTKTLPNSLGISNSSVYRIVVPSDLTTIGAYAFSQCTNLVELILPKTLNNVVNNAFYNTYCDSITNLSTCVATNRWGLSHKDKFKTTKITKQPTCTETGCLETNCINCDFYYELKSIPALGHNWVLDETYTDYKDYKCSRCGAYARHNLFFITSKTENGSYLGEGELPTTTTDKYGWKRIRYTNPAGEIDYFNPYGSQYKYISVKPNTTIYFDMYSGTSTNTKSSKIETSKSFSEGSNIYETKYGNNGYLITATIPKEEVSGDWALSIGSDYYNSTSKGTEAIWYPYIDTTYWDD